MAEEQIIIDVKVNTTEMQQELSAAIHSVAELKKEQNYLRKEIEAGNDADGEYALQLAEVNKALEAQQRKVKSTTAVLQAAGKQTITNTMSLDEQRQALNTLQKAYANLSGEQKEIADMEGGLRDQIDALSDSVKEQEAAMGDYRRNVGNYAGGIKDAFQTMDEASGPLNDVKDVFETMGPGGKAAASAVEKLSKYLKLGGVAAKAMEAGEKGATGAQLSLNAAMKANPIGLIITAITTLISLYEVFKSMLDDTEESQEKLNEEMERNIKLIEGYAQSDDRMTKSAKNVYEVRMQERERELELMAAQGKSEEELSKKRKENYEEDAKDLKRFVDNQTHQLNNLALQYEKEGLSVRNSLGNITKEYIEIKKEGQEEMSSLYPDNKEYAENAAKYSRLLGYINAISDAETNLSAIEHGEAVKSAQEATTAREKYTESLKEQAKTREELEKQAAEFAVSIIQDEGARAIAQRQLAGDREIAKLKKQLETDASLTKDSKALLSQLITDKQKALDDELDKMAQDQAQNKLNEDLERQRTHDEKILSFRIENAEEQSDEWLKAQQQLLDLQMEMELESTNYTEDEKQLIRDAYHKRFLSLIQEEEKETTKSAEKIKSEYASAYKSIGQAASSVFSALESLVDDDEENNAANAKAKKGFALAGIIADEAAAIASGVQATMNAIEGATKAGAETGIAAPFTTPAFIAEMVGIVGAAIASTISGIAEAKNVLAGSYETGGIIPGTSYSGDKLRVAANSREMVLTQTQQKQLFDLANSGYSSANLDAQAAVFAAAVAATPAPVMVYSEFNDFTNRTETYTEIAKV